MVTGEEGETNPRLLWDDKRPVLQKGAVDAFLMAEPGPLGELSHIRLGFSSAKMVANIVKPPNQGTENFAVHQRGMSSNRVVYCVFKFLVK